MNTNADKTQENKSKSVANAVNQTKSGRKSTFQFIDNRPEAVSQLKLQEMANKKNAKQSNIIQRATNNVAQRVDLVGVAVGTKLHWASGAKQEHVSSEAHGVADKGDLHKILMGMNDNTDVLTVTPYPVNGDYYWQHYIKPDVCVSSAKLDLTFWVNEAALKR